MGWKRKRQKKDAATEPASQLALQSWTGPPIPADIVLMICPLVDDAIILGNLMLVCKRFHRIIVSQLSALLKKILPISISIYSPRYSHFSDGNGFGLPRFISHNLWATEYASALLRQSSCSIGQHLPNGEPHGFHRQYKYRAEGYFPDWNFGFLSEEHYGLPDKIHDFPRRFIFLRHFMNEFGVQQDNRLIIFDPALVATMSTDYERTGILEQELEFTWGFLDGQRILYKFSDELVSTLPAAMEVTTYAMGRRHGIQSDYHWNDAKQDWAIHETYTCVNDEIEGEMEEFDKTGEIKVASTQFRNGVREGENSYWDPITSQLISSCNYKSGIKHGTEVTHYGIIPDSVSPVEIHTKNWDYGVRDGISSIIDVASGNARFRITYKDGRKHGSQEFYDPETWRLIKLVNWTKDRKDGEQRECHASGQVVTSRYYAMACPHSKLHGVEQTWSHETGILTFEGNYEYGSLSGRMREWDGETGFLHHECWYQQGHKHGIEIIYNEDTGAKISEKIWKDGYQFGDEQTWDEDGAKIQQVFVYGIPEWRGKTHKLNNWTGITYSQCHHQIRPKKITISEFQLEDDKSSDLSSSDDSSE